MQRIRKHFSAVWILTFSFLMIIFYVVMTYQCSKYTENFYDISEIESGVYAIQSQGISAASLRKYDVVEVCIDGTLRKFEGDVTISFTEKKPYVFAETNGLSYSDKVHIYIPKGTLMREAGMSGTERRDQMHDE